jgi:hypothetical protein
MAKPPVATDKRYPRVGDALTLHVLRAPALRLAGWAEAAGVRPVAVVAAQSLLSLLVFVCFWRGWYWIGLLVAVLVMLLAAAGFMAEGNAKRARGAAGTFLPLLWWWGWAHGLAAYGRPLHPVYALMVLWVVIGGAVAIWAVETLSAHRFGIELHAWRPFDTRFRSVSAAPNTNLVILAGALLLRRPDSGLVVVAWWTLISLIVHAVRLAQMTERQARRLKVESWLDQ